MKTYYIYTILFYSRITTIPGIYTYQSTSPEKSTFLIFLLKAYHSEINSTGADQMSPVDSLIPFLPITSDIAYFNPVEPVVEV